MAGDRRERKRLPKRPFRGERERGENSSADLNETPSTQQALICTDRNEVKAQRGKENHATKTNTTDLPEKVDDPAIYGPAEQTDHNVFFDEDSNQIFPVEQFFGNLDAVQDYSSKAITTEKISRREYRRRHYYAKEDSDEEQT